MLGAEICRLLATENKKVRALVRPTSNADKKMQLVKWGCEVFEGDLKDGKSLSLACRGVQSIISTASSTFSRQDGDSIQSVDHDGQLRLVDAAQDAGAKQFIYISFPPTPDFPNALNDAKRAVENRLKESNLDWTVLHANYFMEVWISPAVGFDYANRTVRLYGEEYGKTSWISVTDVARFATACVDNRAVSHRTLSIGGPKALSPQEVVDLFESKTGVSFQVEKVPVAALKSQWEEAPDPLSRAFASLMLTYAHGWPMEMDSLCSELGLEGLTSVAQYADQMLAES